MTDLLYWIFASGLSFFVFVITFIIGLIGQKKLLRVSVFVGIISFGCAAITAYKFITKSYKKINTVHVIDKPFKARSGEDIYQSLFGKSPYQCSYVINHKDHTVPVLDCCIWLEFKTCPREIQRLLKPQQYKITRLGKLQLDLENPDFGEKPVWWTPQVLGDTVLMLKFKHPDQDRLQTFIVSLDSTKAYYYDVVY